MSRLLASSSLLAVCLASGLSAQEKPTAAQQQALTGKWSFDQSRSDTITTAIFLGGGGAGGLSLGGGGTNHAGGGGRGGGGRGGRSTASTPNADSMMNSTNAARPAGPPQLRDPKLQALAGEALPGAGIIIGVNDSAVSVANSAGEIMAWKTDGKKRQDVQMDGSIVETTASWSSGTLTLVHNMVGSASLKREFKPGKENTLEVKETVESNSGHKVDKKLVFTHQ